MWQAISSGKWRRVGDVFSTNRITFFLGPACAAIALIAAIFSYGILSTFGASYNFASNLKSGSSIFREIEDFGLLTELNGPNSGNSASVYYKNEPLVTISISGTSDKIRMSWRYHYTLWDRIDSADGGARRSGSKDLILVSDSALWAPFVRNTSLEIPSGTVEPLVRQIIVYLERRLDERFDRNQLDDLVESVTRYILVEAGYGAAISQVLGTAFWSGDVQFMTLFVFYSFLLITIVTIFSSRLEEASSFLLEALPYLGFFGTLMGMASALKILGFANLSNDLEKAIGLGPIGSQMSLAIETTKFALVLYLAGGAFAHLVYIGFDRLRNATGAVDQDRSE